MDLAKIALALSDPIRLRILDLLTAGREWACCSPPVADVPEGVCACDIRPRLGNIGLSRLSYHMKLLREAGLVRETRRGRWVYYVVDRDAIQTFARALTERYGRPRGAVRTVELPRPSVAAPEPPAPRP